MSYRWEGLADKDRIPSYVREGYKISQKKNRHIMFERFLMTDLIGKLHVINCLN